MSTFNTSYWQGGPSQATRNQAPSDPEETELTVTLLGDTPIFANPANGYAIWAASRSDASRQLTVKGSLGNCVGGDLITVSGRWENRPPHGWGFIVDGYKPALPQTAEGVSKWLQRRVKGVGPAFADAIVAHFGADKVFDTISADPQLLRQVKTSSGRAVSEKQVDLLIEEWDRVKHVYQLEVFLYSFGVSASLTQKLYEWYGNEVMNILKKDPYRISEIKGIGFKTADLIARGSGVPLDDPRRLQAGMLYVLEKAEDDGHVFLPIDQLIARASESEEKGGLGVGDATKMVEECSVLAQEHKIIVQDSPRFRQIVYRRKLYELEVELARRIRWMLNTPTHLEVSAVRPEPPDGLTADEARAEGIFVPTDDQWQAVEMVLERRLTLLTGLPGTGKTASQQVILEAAENAGLEILQAAPTGKAARRMAEVSKRNASTIHRLLGWSPMIGGFEHDENNPIECDLLIIDEASMLSLDLAVALFRAIGPNTHVLLVGDTDQLPPIGAGKVLDDLVRSKVVPITRLTQIFRQAARSMIIVNAHRINKGETPMTTLSDHQKEFMDEDFYFRRCEDAEDVANLTVQFMCDRIPRKFGHDPIRDIMVLAPMHKGPCGLDALNQRIQDRLNPDGERVNKTMRVGDRIIQTKNDYNIGQYGVMNGEVAMLISADKKEGTARISLDDGERIEQVPLVNLESFRLAYAISVHRSQGSQFKAVIVPMSSSYWVMLTRALLYTAVTRAQELVVMPGENKALHQAVNKVDLKQRHSGLSLRVRIPEQSGELF